MGLRGWLRFLLAEIPRTDREANKGDLGGTVNTRKGTGMRKHTGN